MGAVLDAIADHAVRRPAALALGGETPLAYGALPGAIAETVERLSPLVDLTRPVAVLLDNGPAWVLVDLALMSLGAPALPLPPFFTADQRRHAMEDAGVASLVRPAAPGEAAVEIAGVRIAVDRLATAAARLPRGVAKITYTSGSTGAPKGVCLSLEHMERTAQAVVTALGPAHAGRHLPLLPLSVLLENVAGLYPELLAGGCYLPLPLAEVGLADAFRPDFTAMAARIAATEATSLILVPELARGLMAAISATGARLTHLTFAAVGGARVAPDLIAQARALGLPLYEGYGLSECGSVVTLNTPGRDRPGSVGAPLPGFTVTLAEDGEIIAGPGGFLGYVGQAERSGPIRTGDLGAIDAEGFVSVSGRRGNRIITAFGRNVSPEWVESELLAQPQIAQAAVFGEGQASLDAILVPSSPDVTPEALAAAVARANSRLPDYARVARWTAGPPFDHAAGELTGNGRPRRDVIQVRRGRQPAFAESA